MNLQPHSKSHKCSGKASVSEAVSTSGPVEREDSQRTHRRRDTNDYPVERMRINAVCPDPKAVRYTDGSELSLWFLSLNPIPREH